MEHAVMPRRLALVLAAALLTTGACSAVRADRPTQEPPGPLPASATATVTPHPSVDELAIATQVGVIVDRDPAHWGGVFFDDGGRLTAGVYGRSVPQAQAILEHAGITGGIRLVSVSTSVAAFNAATERITQQVAPKFPGSLSSYGPDYVHGTVTVSLLRDSPGVRTAILASVGPDIPITYDLA